MSCANYCCKPLRWNIRMILTDEIALATEKGSGRRRTSLVLGARVTADFDNKKAKQIE